jgi:hypothetical protein
MIAQTQVTDTTLNRTVVVEQEYNPDIRDAVKVNVLPEVETPVVVKEAVEYDHTLLPATEIPATAIPVYSRREIPDKAPRGYARLGYGNYGNLDVAGGYLFALSRTDIIGVDLYLKGMNGKLDNIYQTGKWRSRYYRTHAGVNYTHGFDAADLDIAAHFDLHNFNYHPQVIRDRQKFTAGDFHIGIHSTDRTASLQYHLAGYYKLFGRKHFFTYDDVSENYLNLQAGALGRISEEQHIAVDFTLDNLTYSQKEIQSQTIIHANPYYLYDNDDWRIKLGARVDYTFGFDKGINAAPDISLQYTFADSYVLYAQATGGMILNDFRRLAELQPYSNTWMPISSSLHNSYERLNAAVGFKASPAVGLWFNLYGGYQNMKNDLGTTVVVAQASQYYPAGFFDLIPLNVTTYNYYVGAELRYDYKEQFTATASGVYRHWDAKEIVNYEGFDYLGLLAFKPAFEGNLRLDYRPIQPLKLHVGMHYIARPSVQAVESLRYKKAPVNNLYIGVDYNVFDAVTIYAQLNNLLNKKYEQDWYYAAERFNFVGGLRFRF